MTTSKHAISSTGKTNGKKDSRTQAIIAAALVSLSGLGLMLNEPASAVCIRNKTTNYKAYCTSGSGKSIYHNGIRYRKLYPGY